MVVRIGKKQATANRSNGIDGGIALILVMLAMIVLSLLAAAIVFTARADILASYNYKLSTQDDYLAKAGVQEALNWFRSARYQAVSQAQAPTYYNVTATGSIYTLYSSASSPVKCISSSGCPSTNNPVQLIGIPGTGSTNYPNITNSGGTAVATAFASDLVNARLTGDAIDSGTFSINAVLLNYQTLNSGTPPDVAPIAVETWLITSRATWTGGSGSSAAVATAEEQAVVQPLYFPSYGHALYGYCSVTMQGSAGVCTDAFNSALGAYGGGNVTVASGQCDSETATNVISADAGVGANGGVTLGSNVVVSGNVSIGTTPTAGCTASGFTGNTSSVLGQVLNGPHVDPTPPPTFPTGFPTGAPGYTLSGSGATQTLPLGASADPSFGYPGTSPPYSTWTEPCMSGQTCDGTKDHPYLIDSIRLQNNSAKLSLVGSSSSRDPVYYDIDSFQQNGGLLVVTGYVVLNVRSSFSISGSGISNGVTSDISPEYVKINYAGTSGISLGGSGAVSALIDAPNASVTLGGGGSHGYMVGAIKANNIVVQGGYPVHFDVQLNRAGGSVGVLVTTGYSRSKY
jgi:Tfp pilus assembly protein PilV